MLEITFGRSEHFFQLSRNTNPDPKVINNDVYEHATMDRFIRLFSCLDRKQQTVDFPDALLRIAYCTESYHFRNNTETIS